MSDYSRVIFLFIFASHDKVHDDQCNTTDVEQERYVIESVVKVRPPAHVFLVLNDCTFHVFCIIIFEQIDPKIDWMGVTFLLGDLWSLPFTADALLSDALPECIRVAVDDPVVVIILIGHRLGRSRRGNLVTAGACGRRFVAATAKQLTCPRTIRIK